MELKEVSVDEVIENFEFLEDWEQKYMYLIDLGKMIPEFDLNKKTNENLIEGCTSKVWIYNSLDNDKIHFEADSESQIVKGLVALLLILYNDKSSKEILEIDSEEYFKKLELEAHLSGNRANGLRSMLQRIRKEAEIAA